MTEILHMKSGNNYALLHDKMCNQGAWESRAWRWFLFILGEEREYVGDFRTKCEARDHIEQIEGVSLQL